MIEYCSQNVDPSNENSFREIKECFGWQLVDSNEVYNENTYVSGVKTTVYGNDFFGGFMKGFTGNDGKVEVQTQTEVTNYIHMQFARDTSMPNYDKIKSNEDRFWVCLDTTMPDKPFKSTLICVIATLVIVASVVMAIINGTKAAPWEIVVCVVVPIVSVLIMVIMWKRYKKLSEEYDYCMSLARQLLDETEELL